MAQNQIAHHVYLELKKDILAGIYSPGEKLPSERDIAQAKQVSRVSVRDAINRLAQMGLINKIPQSGNYVSDYKSEATLELLIEILKSGKRIDENLLFSLLEFRRLVESYAVKKGTSFVSSKVIDKLKNIVDDMEAAVLDPKTLTRLDFEFHFTLVTLSQNMVIQVLFNNFKDIYLYYTQIFYGLGQTGQQCIDYYRKLTKAMENKDGDYANYIMEQVLVYGENKMKQAMDIYARDV